MCSPRFWLAIVLPPLFSGAVEISKRLLGALEGRGRYFWAKGGSLTVHEAFITTETPGSQRRTFKQPKLISVGGGVPLSSRINGVALRADGAGSAVFARLATYGDVTGRYFRERVWASEVSGKDARGAFRKPFSDY